MMNFLIFPMKVFLFNSLHTSGIFFVNLISKKNYFLAYTYSCESHEVLLVAKPENIVQLDKVGKFIILKKHILKLDDYFVPAILLFLQPDKNLHFDAFIMHKNLALTLDIERKILHCKNKF